MEDLPPCKRLFCLLKQVRQNGDNGLHDSANENDFFESSHTITSSREEADSRLPKSIIDTESLEVKRLLVCDSTR